jgi:hypothetical protein
MQSKKKMKSNKEKESDTDEKVNETKEEPQQLIKNEIRCKEWENIKKSN